MDDAASEATQPATQLMMDPRRLGENPSDLEDEDMGDIFCILHPASPTACTIASNINDYAPQLTVTRDSAPIKVRAGDEDPQINPTDTMELAEQGKKSCDIALRLSTVLKDPTAGYVFGRNSKWADFVLTYESTEGMKRISNRHFRIWLERSGVIMLEDTSTNGTWVENKHLRAQNKENGGVYKHTLVTGSLIRLQMVPESNEDIKFIVKLPIRQGSIYEDIFHENLVDYFKKLEAHRLQRVAKEVVVTDGIEAPNLFAVQHQAAMPVSELRRSRVWYGGPKYNRGDMIGKGAFASVYMVTAKYDGTQYAAKEIEKRKFMKNGILDLKIESEMKIMEKIRHPNIVQFIEHIDWTEHIYIIMDFVPNGPLSNYVEEYRRQPFAEDDTKDLARQMLSALKYLNKELGVTHRDIKPDNILVHEGPPNLCVKLTDFGLSKLVNNDDTNLRTFCGTILYCAPEVYPNYIKYSDDKPKAVADKKAGRYDSSVDLWSLAGVLFWSLCLKPPFPAEGRVEVDDMLHTIMTGALDVRPLQMRGVSTNGINFIKSMLINRPKFRATIDQLEAMPWLNSASGDSSAESSQRSYYKGRTSDDTPMSGYDGSDVGDPDPQGSHLAESASQLSLYEGEGGEIDEADEIDLLDTVTRPLEIPSSFQSDSYIENSEISPSEQVTPRLDQQPRLFGEVNGVSANSSGSESGIFPHAGLPLPLGNGNGESKAASSGSDEYENLAPRDSQIPNSTPFYDAQQSNNSDMVSFDSYLNSAGASRQALASSTTLGPRQPSLTGAESMVGDMAINSPSPAATSAQPSFVTGAASLRRPRETSSDEEEPVAKRHQSMAEEISDMMMPVSDIIMPFTTFWDVKDAHTLHKFYPKLTVPEYNDAVELAAKDGEKFQRGGKVWDQIIGTYQRQESVAKKIHDFVAERAAKFASFDPPRTAQPPPLMRDDRSVGMDEESVGTSSQDISPDISQSQPYNDPSASLAVQTSIASANASAISEFQPPRRILAKLISTPESALKDYTITITELITTWGRARDNLVIFPEHIEDRISRHAIKLIFFRKGIKPGHAVPVEADNDFEFFIATKCRFGIYVNGVEVKANLPDDHPRQIPARYWVKLQHGDIVTVWKSAIRDESVTFRFDAFWGPSKTPRAENEKTELVRDKEMIKALDFFCMWEENRRVKDMFEGDEAQAARAGRRSREGSRSRNGSRSRENSAGAVSMAETAAPGRGDDVGSRDGSFAATTARPTTTPAGGGARPTPTGGGRGGGAGGSTAADAATALSRARSKARHGGVIAATARNALKSPKPSFAGGQ